MKSPSTVFVTLLGSILTSIHLVADVPSPVETLRGADYYRYISDEANVRQFVSSKINAKDPTNLAMHSIFEERAKHPEVFEEYQSALHWIVESFSQNDGRFFCRPGFFEGLLWRFLVMGPENERWPLARLDSNGCIWLTSTEHHFSTEEIEDGRARNKAARMAFLETIIKGMDRVGGYEQWEMLSLAQSLWGKGGIRTDDNVDISQILFSLSKDGLLHPVVEIIRAENELTMGERRALYNALLEDEQSPREDFYGWYVQEAVEFLRENYPEDLEHMKTALRWKQRILNSVRVLPAPLDFKDRQETEVEIL